MRKLDEQEQLRKRVVLACHAFRQPLPCDRQDLRKQPALHVGIKAMVSRLSAVFFSLSSRKYFLKRELREQKCDLVVAPPFQIIERVYARFADNRMILGFRRNIGRGQCQSRVGSEAGAQTFRRYLVSITHEARESDLTGNALFKRRTRVGVAPGFGLAVEPEHGINEKGTP